MSCISANVNEKKIKPSSDSSTMNSGKMNLQKEPNNMSEYKLQEKKTQAKFENELKRQANHTYM